VEIDEALIQLHLHQQEHAIDLRGLFQPDQTETLKNILGKGEVNIKLDMSSPTEIEETALSGVWWITHYNHLNEKQCEIVEIALVPKLIFSTEIDILYAQQKIKTIINQLA